MITRTADFYLVVDSPLENTLCDNASNKQIETREFYNMNEKSIIDFTKRYNKSELILHCRKCDPDSVHQNRSIVNSDDLPPLVVLHNYLYIEEEI